MASNLSSIGFAFESADYAGRLMAELAGYASWRISTIPGDYAVWRSGAGAEIWFHVEGERNMFGRMENGRVVAFRPFFCGEGDVAVRVLRAVQGPDDNPFEGVLVVEAGEAGDAIPIAFNAVDYAVHALRDTPFAGRVRLVGFAREVTIFASEAEFQAGLDGRDLAVRSFVGDRQILFGAADNDNAPAPADGETDSECVSFLPMTHAVLRGYVRKYQRLENEVSERDYHWILIDGPEGTFDVVADRDMIAGPLDMGMIVQTIATFSGRLID